MNDKHLSLNGHFQPARIRTIWFDLDATLYDPHNGLWAQIGARIEDYLHLVMGHPRERIEAIKRDYHLRYGTTLRGLQLHEQVDTKHYLDYVHDVPVKDYLSPDPVLRAMLLRLRQRRWIFSNSDAGHVGRVLDALSISDCFDGRITIERLDYHCKPNLEAYEMAMRISGETDPDHILFLDDSAPNLAGAQGLGVHTVLIGSSDPQPGADYSLDRLLDLPERFPDLFTL